MRPMLQSVLLKLVRARTPGVTATTVIEPCNIWITSAQIPEEARLDDDVDAVVDAVAESDVESTDTRAVVIARPPGPPGPPTINDAGSKSASLQSVRVHAEDYAMALWALVQQGGSTLCRARIGDTHVRARRAAELALALKRTTSDTRAVDAMLTRIVDAFPKQHQFLLARALVPAASGHTLRSVLDVLLMKPKSDVPFFALANPTIGMVKHARQLREAIAAFMDTAFAQARRFGFVFVFDHTKLHDKVLGGYAAFARIVVRHLSLDRGTLLQFACDAHKAMRPSYPRNGESVKKTVSALHTLQACPDAVPHIACALSAVFQADLNTAFVASVARNYAWTMAVPALLLTKSALRFDAFVVGSDGVRWGEVVLWDAVSASNRLQPCLLELNAELMSRVRRTLRCAVFELLRKGADPNPAIARAHQAYMRSEGGRFALDWHVARILYVDARTTPEHRTLLENMPVRQFSRLFTLKPPQWAQAQIEAAEAVEAVANEENLAANAINCVQRKRHRAAAVRSAFWWE